MSPSVQADMLCIDAANAGEHLWRSIELTPCSNRVKAFEIALEVICEKIDCDYARTLFHDTAMLSIRTMVDAKRRKAIDNAADDAWGEYVRFLQDEHAQETADHYVDMEREERLLGDAA